MRSRPLAVLACMGIALTFAAASDSADLIGTWDYSSITTLKHGKPFGTIHFRPGQTTITFKSDGTWTLKPPSDLNPTGVSGTYKLRGQNLEMKLNTGREYAKYRLKLEQDGKVLVLTEKDSIIVASRT